MLSLSRRGQEFERFAAYGEDYIQFFIVDYERLWEWAGINWPDFQHAMANANQPPFDPCGDLGEEDEDGKLYDCALEAAYDYLSRKLYEASPEDLARPEEPEEED